MTIKKISLLVATLLLSANIYCQPKHLRNVRFDNKSLQAEMPYHNGIGIFTNHSNWGLGISYDHRWEEAGLYIRACTGDFSEDNYYQLEREYKISAGMLIGTWLIQPDPEWWPMIMFGMSYNYYTMRPEGEYDKKLTVMQPFDIELGMTGQIGRIAPFCTTSLMKWQFLFGLKYLFNFKKPEVRTGKWS